MGKLKTGKLTNKEKEEIENLAPDMSYQQIALLLKRRPQPIKKYITEQLGMILVPDSKQALNIQYNLQSRPYWKHLKEQFSEDELELIIWEWARMIEQFKDDVLATEELQILDAIKLEVLVNRNLKEQQQSKQRISEIEEQIVKEELAPIENRNNEYIFELNRQLSFFYQGQNTLGRDFRDYMDKKKNILKSLKATREDRIKRYEDSRETFSGWVKRIIADRKLRQEIGERIEKMRLAMDNELERLSQWHKYDDGTLDQPILTPENVKDE